MAWTSRTQYASDVTTYIESGVENAITAQEVRERFAAIPDSVEWLGEVAAINVQTGSYTLVLTDRGKVIEMNVGSANNLTVPPNSSVAFPVNTRIDITQVGAGQTTIVAGSGVTIRQRETKLKIAGQWGGASLYKRATDEWVLFGDVSA